MNITRALWPSVSYVAKVSLIRDEIRDYVRHAKLAGANARAGKAIISLGGMSTLIHYATIRADTPAEAHGKDGGPRCRFCHSAPCSCGHLDYPHTPTHPPPPNAAPTST